MRRPLGILACVLGATGCFLAQSASNAPGPGEAPPLEARVATHPTDLDAVVALATLHMLEGRLEEARDLLVRADEWAPGDPSVPFLLAVADERRGEIARAQEGYHRYRSTHYGVLARRAEQRLLAASPAAVAFEVRALLRAPLEELPPVDPGTIAVVPLAQSVPDRTLEAEAAAVGALIGADLSARGARVVDAMRTRALLDAMDLSGTARAELAAGVELGRRLGAGKVIQASARRISLDTVEWNATVTTIESPSSLSVDVVSLSGGTGNAPLMQARLTSMVRQTLEGRTRPVQQTTAISTLDHDALLAFGSGLLAMDRNDWGAAHAAFMEAVRLDGQFDYAVAMAAWADAARDAPPLDSLTVEVARIGGLQRSVQGLRREAARSGGIGHFGDRAIISDMLGLDAIGGGVLMDVTLTPPGGDR